MALLTVEVDDAVYAAAQAEAQARQVSLAQLVELKLGLGTRTAALLGQLAGADVTVEDYRRHLAGKHGS